VVRFLQLLAIGAIFLVGCQAKDEPLATAITKEKVIGEYRLKATPDEVAELGGLEKLPLLLIKADHWRMVVDGEESGGTWQIDGDQLSLQDKATGETTRFKPNANATELSELGEDPIVFARFGVPQSQTKKE
jgi:hypothetical protein